MRIFLLYIRKDHCKSIIKEKNFCFVPIPYNYFYKFTFYFQDLYNNLLHIKHKILFYLSVEKKNYKTSTLYTSTYKSEVIRRVI